MNAEPVTLPIRLSATVDERGHVDVPVPLRPGTAVTLLLSEGDEPVGDLVAAASTSLDFWDNALDDEWDEAIAELSA